MSKKISAILCLACTASALASGCGAGSTPSPGGGDGDADSDSDADADSDSGTGSGADDCELLAEALLQVADGAVAHGLAVGVRTPECGRWVAARGEAEIGVALTEDRLLRIASVTKTFTAAAILRLVELEQLSLDDTADGFVSGLPNGEVITIRHLLRHESGLFDIVDDSDFMQQAFANPEVPLDPEEMVAVAASHGALFEPGAHAAYCNTNYHVLGLVIQQVTGLSAGEAIEQQVLEPLALSATVLEGDPPMDDVLAPGFGSDLEDLTGLLHPTIRWTAGAMVTNIDDLLSWTAGLYRGALLGAELQGAMVEQCVDVPGACIGLGVVVRDVDGVGEVWGHGGEAPGYRACIAYAPELDAAAAVMANDVQTDASAAADALLGAVADVLR